MKFNFVPIHELRQQFQEAIADLRKKDDLLHLLQKQAKKKEENDKDEKKEPEDKSEDRKDREESKEDDKVAKLIEALCDKGIIPANLRHGTIDDVIQFLSSDIPVVMLNPPEDDEDVNSEESPVENASDVKLPALLQDLKKSVKPVVRVIDDNSDQDIKRCCMAYGMERQEIIVDDGSGPRRIHITRFYNPVSGDPEDLDFLPIALPATKLAFHPLGPVISMLMRLLGKDDPFVY
jgi:hypothetical protein